MPVSSNEVEINVRVNADQSGWGKARSTAASEGRAAGDEYVRGADGKLRDGKGRFVSAGEAAGAGFSDGLSRGASKGGGFTATLNKTSKDLNKFQGDVSKAGSAAGSAAAGIGQLSVGAAIVGWAPAAAAALAQLAGAALVLPGAMGAAASILGVVKMALSGVSEAIGAQGGVSADMAKSGAAAAAMARQIRDAVDNVNDARENAARVAEDSARRVENAERNAARVARDGAEAIADAKARVREAAEDTAEAVAEANERLAETEEQVARQIQDAVEALDDARKSAARTLERTARSGADAVARAADRVSKALEREQEAQEDLSQARVDAADDLEDLQAKVAGYAADEGSAQAKVARAAEELRKVNASRRFSDVDRQEAAADLAQAEQHLADIQREGRQDAAELAKVQAGGVEASKKVQDAAERVADAHEAVVDATNDRARAEQDAAENNSDAAEQAADRIADAEQRVTDAREDGARRIQDAQAAVTKAAEDGAERQAAAQAALTRAERDAAEASQDAQRAVADARREAAQAQADAAGAVADAEQRLNDTYAQQKEQAAQTAAATDTYAAALAKLSPNAQAFVEQIRALRPEWEALQQLIQQNAFAGMAQTVSDLAATYFPVLRTGLGGIATDLNAMAQYAASALMSPEAVAAVNAVLQFTSQFLQESRTALGDFLVGFLGLMEIGASYLPQFGAWLADIAQKFRDWINTKEGRDEIRGWIEGAFTAFGQLWQILQNVWGAVVAVGSALGGGQGGKGLLQYLVELSEKLKAVAERRDTQDLLRAIGEAARAFFQFIVDHLPQVAELAIALGAISAAAKILSPVLDAAKVAIGGVKLAIEAWKLAQLALNLAMSMNPIGLIVIAIGLLVAALIYAWNNSETFRNVVTNAWKTVQDYVGRAVDWIKGKLRGMWDGVKEGAKAAVNGAIWALNWAIDAANGAIRALNILPGPDLPLIGKFGFLAHGGIAGGMAVVGENGPELVKLPQGSQVYPSGQSQGMADKLSGGRGGGGGGRIELVVSGNTDGAMATALQKLIRTGQIQIRQSQLVG